jgi:hypothetical protein
LLNEQCKQLNDSLSKICRHTFTIMYRATDIPSNPLPTSAPKLTALGLCVQSASNSIQNNLKIIMYLTAKPGRSSKKINNAISGLQADAIFPVGIKTPEEYSQKMILNLRKLRNEIIDEVNSCFDEKERTIESEIHNRWKVYQSFAQGNIKL